MPQIFQVQVNDLRIHAVDVSAENLDDALEKAKEMFTDNTLWHKEVTTEIL